MSKQYEGLVGTQLSIRRILFTFVYAISGLCAALLLSWILLAQFNFLYGFWHDNVGIAEGIEEYGPQNRYRQGFADTTRDERIRLFAAINRAIHHSGEGLADIEYRSASVKGPQPLLRAPEVGHLEDVAHLVNVLSWSGAFMVLIWIACSAWAVSAGNPLPKLRHQMLGICGLFLLVGIVVLITGPVQVFNQLHIWIFPDEHPWFFYYQDSLMSTMMLAPRLFGWITVVWVPLTLLCYLGLHFVAALLLRVDRRRGL